MAGISINVTNDFGKTRREIDQIRYRVRRTLRGVSRSGARDFKAGARARAPVKKQGRIPRSLGRVETKHHRSPAGQSTGWDSSITSRYIPAVVTNEGSGKYGDKKRPYKIQTKYGEFMHPGVKRTNWFGKAFNESVRPYEKNFDMQIRQALGIGM